MNSKQIEHNLSDVSISEDEKTESMPDDQSLQ